MGHQIIRQPNDLYMIASSGSGLIEYWDATEDEVIQFFVAVAAQEARDNARQVMDLVKEGRLVEAYGRSNANGGARAKTFDEAIREDAYRGGDAWNALQDLYDPAVLR